MTLRFRRQVAVNLLPDDSSFDFHERDALHYHCYDLEPLLALNAWILSASERAARRRASTMTTMFPRRPCGN